MSKAEKTFDIEMKRTLHLTTQDIDDIMVSALEGGGITYWADEAEVIEEKRVADWGHEQIARGGSLIIHDAESDDKWELTLEKFLAGFQLWFEKGYDEYGAIQSDGTVDCCEIDGNAADSIVQFALFGELVFG